MIVIAADVASTRTVKCEVLRVAFALTVVIAALIDLANEADVSVLAVFDDGLYSNTSLVPRVFDADILNLSESLLSTPNEYCWPPESPAMYAASPEPTCSTFMNGSVDALLSVIVIVLVWDAGAVNEVFELNTVLVLTANVVLALNCTTELKVVVVLTAKVVLAVNVTGIPALIPSTLIENISDPVFIYNNLIWPAFL